MGVKTRSNYSIPFCIKQGRCANSPKRCKTCWASSNFKQIIWPEYRKTKTRKAGGK